MEEDLGEKGHGEGLEGFEIKVRKRFWGLQKRGYEIEKKRLEEF